MYNHRVHLRMVLNVSDWQKMCIISAAVFDLHLSWPHKLSNTLKLIINGTRYNMLFLNLVIELVCKKL